MKKYIATYCTWFLAYISHLLYVILFWLECGELLGICYFGNLQQVNITYARGHCKGGVRGR